MTRAIHKLSSKTIEAATKRGLYSDGGGLFFQVTKHGHRSWVYRFRIQGRLRTMGLGPYPRTTLKKARELAKAAAEQVHDGIDPIVARGQSRIAAARSLTLQQAATAHVAAQRPKWKTKKYAGQIERRLKNYVYPIIGHLPIADVRFAEIKQVLAPIWITKHATAGRVRSHLEGIIDWAIAEGHRADESNPAEIKRLKFSLPVGIHKVRHFPSLPYSEAPRFLAELRQQEGIKAKALEFIVLCAVRVADVVGGGKDRAVPMLWQHVDLPGQVWRIPDTKMGRPHTVPLSDEAMMVLGEMQRYRDASSDYVFPGAVRGTVVNDATLRYLLQDMGYAGIATTHGLRATFRTWASETTTYDKDVIETALAHAQGELDSAYHRGSFLAKRVRLMSDWATYLAARNVIPLAGTG
jgi:integrase